jgi:hypothetical protein
MAESGLEFDICYDENDKPILGNSTEADFMRMIINSASPPLDGADTDGWLGVEPSTD